MKRFARAAILTAVLAGAGLVWGAPGRSAMLTPATGDCMNRRPEFRWTPAPDATQYLLSITRNGSPYLQKWTRKTDWAPRFDLPEGVYEARVIAYDGAEYGQWSFKTRIRRVFSPTLSSINGVGGDGAAITLQAGPGIAIEPDASNRTVLISSTGITATLIIDRSITTGKIENDAVTEAKLADDAVTETKIADQAVTEAKLADGSVTTPKLAPAAVTAAQLATNSVTSLKIADGAVTESKLIPDAVTSLKIAAAAVTESKLADGSVTSNKLAPGSVLMSHLDSAGAVYNQVMKWNGVSWGPGSLLYGYSEGSMDSSPMASGGGAIALGESNVSEGSASAVLGGRANSILDGASFSVVAGGNENTIYSNSLYSSILGGKLNYITHSYSLVAGRQARATNDGCFVWADATGGGAGSWGANTVLFQANGGVRFQSSAPIGTNQRVQWVPGGSSWAFSSDRNLKEGFIPVDPRAVLEKVVGLPVSTWRFKGYDRVHMGVMAQDFYAAFPFEGAEETMIDSADLQGVTLGAVQGLYEELQAEKARNDALEARIRQLEERLGE